MPYRKRFILFFVILCIFSGRAYTQPTWTLDPFGREEKPEKYEEKKLASEKTADKKFTTFRRFLQNNTTHYNYYFNATNKINGVLERAKMSNKDDYSKLLSFYPYSLENTATQQVELDSVIYKATAGILLHDLRSDWVDNMYLLIGQSYYYRKEFDSAALTFQFINYNLFPRKKKEDDNRVVGTNQSSTSSILSIANKENRNILHKITSLPPSRNDALIWLARTLTDQKEYSDAAGLINLLSNDPNLPSRLKNDLAEVNAYWFYQQDNYDSAAVYLENALSNAADKQEKARWEFLLAQMYEMGGQHEKASDYYAKASKHTVDPVMDIHARLNDAKMFRDKGNIRELEKSIAALLKMAKKDRYEAYRDIIYYSTGQLSLQKPDTANGTVYYSKSIKYNSANPGYRNKSFLQLGNIAYNQRQYKMASDYYDSLQVDDPSIAEEAAVINARKNSLNNIVAQIEIIEREDSLQRIALMEPAERDDFIKKMIRKYRKEQGLKGDDNFTGSTLITFNNSSNEPIDLFAAPAKGEWYFYNNTLKSRGFSEFRSRWGKRENTDNWRRKSGIVTKSNLNTGINDPLDPMALGTKLVDGAGTAAPVEYTYDALMMNLPLNPEKMDSSNNSIARSLITLAKLFQNDLEDYEEAIVTYEEYLRRFPNRLEEGDVYLGLYFCYSKMGNTTKADYYKNLLLTGFPGSNAAVMITNPSALKPNEKNPEVTRRYESIYNMFIEGKFTEAIDAKKRADSVHGKNYWTPQLLYIESVNYIKEKNDSAAIKVLNDIAALYPTSPLKEKALTMIDVLKRRKQIESYLTNLEITRMEEERIIISDNDSVVVQKPVVAQEVVKPMVSVVKPVIRNDSIVTPPSMISGAFQWEPSSRHFVVMILDKVDGVYVNEARNAFMRYNREKYYNKTININKDALTAEKVLLLFDGFADADEAIAYFDKINKAAAVEVSWLQASKYSFLVITQSNLDILKKDQDLEAYKTLLNQQYPGKF